MFPGTAPLGRGSSGVRNASGDPCENESARKCCEDTSTRRWGAWPARYGVSSTGSTTPWPVELLKRVMPRPCFKSSCKGWGSKCFIGHHRHSIRLLKPCHPAVICSRRLLRSNPMFRTDSCRPILYMFCTDSCRPILHMFCIRTPADQSFTCSVRTPADQSFRCSVRTLADQSFACSVRTPADQSFTCFDVWSNQPWVSVVPCIQTHLSTTLFPNNK